jgi:hypothetical protein
MKFIRPAKEGTSMKHDAESPSFLRHPLFMIGQDSHGHWVARDQNGTRGGLFVNRAEALRYIRFENGNRAQAFVTVAGVLDLDMRAMNVAQRQPTIENQRDRKVA